MTLPFAVTSPCEPPAPPRLQRTEGNSRITFKCVRGTTRLDRLFQVGAAKVRLPLGVTGEPPQAVLINTAGGLTGGDRMATEVSLAAGCRAVVTTQACEKIYRACSGTAEVRNRIAVAEGGRLDWLPQETILFDGARLSRRLEAELALGAELLLVEASIFGRSARGETVRSGLFVDRWRISRQDVLLFADDLHFHWSDPNLLKRPAVLGSAVAMATILFVTDDPARHLSTLRDILGENGGATAFGGKLVARIVAPSGAALRKLLVPALVALRDGTILPKFWRI